MNKGVISLFLAAVMLVFITTGCASQATPEPPAAEPNTETNTEATTEPAAAEATEEPVEQPAAAVLRAGRAQRCVSTRTS